MPSSLNSQSFVGQPPQYTRREVLRAAALGLVALPFASFAATEKQKTFVEPVRVPYAGSDDALLNEIERKAFDFFWNEASATTGQEQDRATQQRHGARESA